MNILFTICARAGSKGLKNKNLKMFLNAPLSYYTLSAIDLYVKAHAEHHCDIALNTDSEALIDLFNQTKIKSHTIDRAPELATDTASKKDVIADSYKKMQVKLDVKYDMVVDLDITSPLRTLKDIENLIDKMVNSDADVVYSVTNARRNPYFNMVKKTEKGYQRVVESPYTARQQAPEIYDMNASLYAYSTKFLMSNKGIFDVDSDVIKMRDTAVLDIDHETDFVYMELIAKYLFEQDMAFNQIRKHIRTIS